MVDISNQQYKILLKDFKNMIERVNKFILKKKRNPKIVYVNPTNSTFYVNYQRYQDMLQRYKQFIQDNNREPNYISTLPPTPNSNSNSKVLGFWIWGSDANKIDFSKLKSVACTDIFLGETAFTSNTDLTEVIQKAKNYDIRVHGWIICLKKDGEWYSPTDTSNFNRVNNLASKMINIGCSGIHLDYVRYPGREVWTGLQTYKSDKEPTPVPKEELEADIMAALKGGATGCVLFRLGLIDPKFWGGSNGS